MLHSIATPDPALPAARRSRRRRRVVLAGALASVALIVVLAAVAVGAPGSPALQALSPSDSSAHALPSAPQLPGAEGAPARKSVFAADAPTVQNLDPELLLALRRAERDAAGDGVRFRVNSGWRSTAEQQRLFRAAVAEHGSAAEAARWVARPGTSPHEAGAAVDLGPTAATTWLARHGAGYGLCQIYRNEPWHFELRRHTVANGCPVAYPNPTRDPRLQR